MHKCLFINIFCIVLIVLLSELAIAEFASEEGVNYYFSFVRSGSNDPLGQVDFGVDQARKVRDAVQNINSGYIMDVELDPYSMTIERLSKTLSDLSNIMNENDTFIMYTHSHGVPRGLMIDFNTPFRKDQIYRWEEFADVVVALPAKNVIIFTMACHSGYFAKAIQAVSEKWQDQRSSNQRSFMVFTSVGKEQLSMATNFSTEFSAIGNPFTYAIRTAMGGNADGAVDGIKDGYTTLEELVTYILKTTKEKSRNQYAEPQFVGEYVADTILWKH